MFTQFKNIQTKVTLPGIMSPQGLNTKSFLSIEYFAGSYILFFFKKMKISILNICRLETSLWKEKITKKKETLVKRLI